MPDIDCLKWGINPGDCSIHNFLENLDLPSLSEADQSALGSPITYDEVIEAIQSLQTGTTQSFIKSSKNH